MTAEDAAIEFLRRKFTEFRETGPKVLHSFYIDSECFRFIVNSVKTIMLDQVMSEVFEPL